VAEWRIPTLFVSHDQGDVRRLADQVVVLEAGRVIDAGPMEDTLRHASLAHLQPINLLRVEDVRQVEGHWQGRVGTQVLHLPAAGAQVQFLPRDVVLAREPVPGISVRNQLAGQVRELVRLDERVFVSIDIGQFLWAEVTSEAIRELDLQPGQPIHCLVKTTALRMIG
jgi:molybdate transport system ATP-binding protein